MAVYTDGSVTWDQSGWWFTVKQGGKTVQKGSGIYRITTANVTMAVEAVTHAIQRLASQSNTHITHSNILTDSMNLLQNVESAVGCANWHTVTSVFRQQRHV